VLCRNQRLDVSLKRLAKVAKVHRTLNPQVSSSKRPGKSLRDQLCCPSGLKPVPYTKCEVQGFRGEILKRSSRARPRVSERGGIKFQTQRFNDMILLHESFMLLLHAYQLCRDAYSIIEIRNAKHQYHRVRRYFSHWDDIYGDSTVVRRWLRVISIVMRSAQNAVKQPGCSLRERQNFVLDPNAASAVAPLPLGVKD